MGLTLLISAVVFVVFSALSYFFFWKKTNNQKPVLNSLLIGGIGAVVTFLIGLLTD